MTSKPSSKREVVDTKYPGLVVFDGFDDAIVGVIDKGVVYDTAKCLRILMDRDGMEEDEAVEWLEFNMAGLYAGEKTPVFMDSLDVAPGE